MAGFPTEPLRTTADFTPPLTARASLSPNREKVGYNRGLLSAELKSAIAGGMTKTHGTAVDVTPAQEAELSSADAIVAFPEECFCNRALFADRYLITRLQEDAAWRESPSESFQQVKELLCDAHQRLLGQGEQVVRDELYEPIFKLLGFTATPNETVGDGQTQPDYILRDADGNTISAAFIYCWDRWLDGPDYDRDQHTPDENPGTCVVTALEEGVADWVMVTNGRQWRLYSRQAHSRATNFYEVDLPAALIAAGDTDPSEAFRYWWLFFRAASFVPVEVQASACSDEQVRTSIGQDQACTPACWLDRIAESCNDYTKELGERLKRRVFEQVFPHLARGFLQDRQQRLGIQQAPDDEDLQDVFQGTLTLLYRLLFLIHAECRDLLPIRETPYHEASLLKIRQEIAEQAGIVQSDVEARLRKAYSAKETTLYDRLCRLFAAMELGDAALNVPTYNGGLFMTQVVVQDSDGDAADASEDSLKAGLQHDAMQEREQQIARFLCNHKVPDGLLALAIDLLSRDEEQKTSELTFIDYKSLAVRHLGSIYEGLLEFKLKVADEDLTAKTEKKKEKYVALSRAKTSRGRKSAAIVVRKGDVYLSNDKAERKASGSYYTPDVIVKYIVEHTVGPVLAEKLDALRPRFRKVQKMFDREFEQATADPVPLESSLQAARTQEGRRSGSENSLQAELQQYWNAREFALEKVFTTHKDLVDELFEFRTLDPAMGSGHFLVEAVDFITDRLLTFLNQFPINPVVVMLAKTRENILEALEEQGVNVDPAHLTDVNLLKRHVLKRCIYGVDLNPMAVELAKVSLWLDAFTIGAPLSFLDHHLRCGNSLVGATFADLRDSLQGRLFGIDDAPLLRAVRDVVFVNTLADATAADVKQSASEYDQARNGLSGYQIVLDLLVAKHFGYENAPDVLTHIGMELDLSSRCRFEESLPGTDRLLVRKVAEVARQPELRFFHWEIEFPEVFYGFVDSDEQQLRHRDELLAGSAGFDAVVGNPPYAGHKGDFDARPLTTFYEVCRDYPNPATAFLERGLREVRTDGHLGMIIPKSIQYVESWAAARCLLAEANRLIGIADVSQAFDEVLLEQTVCIAARQTAIDGYSADTLERDGSFSGTRISASVPAALGCFPARVQNESLSLLEKLLTSGLRLGEISRTSQALGYQAHLNKDMTGQQIPIYRGKQIRPMRIDDPTDVIDRSFLVSARGNDFTGKVREMLGPKVVSQNIVAHVTQPRPRVWVISAPDPEGILCLNTISTTIIRDERFPIEYVAAVLNSTLASWFYTEFVFCRAIRTMHFDDYYAGKLPIASIAANQWDVYSDLARDAETCLSRGARQRKIDAAIFDSYRLSTAEREFLNEYCYGAQDVEAVLTGSR